MVPIACIVDRSSPWPPPVNAALHIGDFAAATCYDAPKICCYRPVQDRAQQSAIPVYNAGGCQAVRDPDYEDPDTSPHAVGGAAKFAYTRAQAEGIDIGPLLREAGLTRQQMEDPDSRIRVE